MSGADCGDAEQGRGSRHIIFCSNFLSPGGIGADRRRPPIAGFSPALRSGFAGASVARSTAAASKAFGPTMKAEAWVRVCDGNSVGPGKQQDALIAGAREIPPSYPQWLPAVQDSGRGAGMLAVACFISGVVTPQRWRVTTEYPGRMTFWGHLHAGSVFIMLMT